MSRKSLLVGAAAALVAAAATGWQGATFNLGPIMGRFANRQRIGEPDNYSGYGKRHPQTVAQSKRAARGPHLVRAVRGDCRSERITKR